MRRRARRQGGEVIAAFEGGYKSAFSVTCRRAKQLPRHPGVIALLECQLGQRIRTMSVKTR